MWFHSYPITDFCKRSTSVFSCLEPLQGLNLRHTFSSPVCPTVTACLVSCALNKSDTDTDK